jgi:hypothetical protein
MNGIQTMGLVPWAKSFYNGWSGRIIITSLDGLFCALDINYWKVLNALVFVNLFYQLDKIIKGNLLDKLLILVLILGMPIATFSSSTLWVTGSFNYLWPVSFSLTIIRIVYLYLKDEKISKLLFIFGIISSVIAGNMEQTSAICLVMLIFSLIYKRGKQSKKILILTILMAIWFAIVILAPGNFIRANSEMLQWNPQFDMYNIFDKLLSGLFALGSYFLTNGKYYFMALSLIIVVNNYKKIINYIPFVYISIKIVIDHLMTTESFYQSSLYRIFGIELFNQSMYLYWSKWISFILFITIIIIFIYCLIDTIDDDVNRIFIILLLLAAFASVVIIGLSPTLRGSGARIYYCCNILLVLVIGLVLKEDIKLKLILILIFAYFSFNNATVFITDLDFMYRLY